MSCLLPEILTSKWFQTFKLLMCQTLCVLTTVRFFPQLYKLGKLSETFKTNGILLLIWVFFFLTGTSRTKWYHGTNWTEGRGGWLCVD